MAKVASASRARDSDRQGRDQGGQQQGGQRQTGGEKRKAHDKTQIEGYRSNLKSANGGAIPF